ncbi:MAG: Chemotaxis protein methyltransferase Cher2, partial [Planctomycetota bacterium]
DLSEQVLAQARSAQYEQRLLAGIPEELQQKYFQTVPRAANAATDSDPSKQLFQVRTPLRKLINYKRHNLIEKPPGKDYDCIFLRNVMIYFDNQSKQVVAKHLQNALADGGYLVVGPAEGLHEQVQNLHRHSAFIYQKTSGARS